MKIIGVIPSRFASTRLPGKPLKIIQGKSIIQRVYEQARQSVSLSDVIVATDDERIFDHVKSFDGKVVMTSPDHPSGTDRCFEAYQKNNEEFDAVINIQGDEPFIHPEQIDELAECISRSSTQIGTLCKLMGFVLKFGSPSEIPELEPPPFSIGGALALIDALDGFC